MGVVGGSVTDDYHSLHYVSKLVMFTDSIDFASVGETRENVTRGRHVANMRPTCGQHADNKHVGDMCYLRFCDKPLASVQYQPIDVAF